LIDNFPQYINLPLVIRSVAIALLLSTGINLRVMQRVIDLRKLIAVWGLFDIITIGWSTGVDIYYGEIPFLYGIRKYWETNTSIFGSHPPLDVLVIPYVWAVCYLSLIVSGIFFLKRHRFAAILSYIQTPFRLISFIPPSIFFILWPLKYIFAKPSVFLGIGLVILSEALKLYSVVRWRRMTKRRVEGGEETKQTTIKPPKILKCRNCAAEYDPADYHQDVLEWICPQCKETLPKE